MIICSIMREICARTLLMSTTNSPESDEESMFLHLPNSGTPQENVDLLYAYARRIVEIFRPHLKCTDQTGWIDGVYDTTTDLLLHPSTGELLPIEFNRAATGTAKYKYNWGNFVKEHDETRCECKMIFSKKTDWFEAISTLAHELIHYINHYEIGMAIHRSSWSKSHGKNFTKYVRIFNDEMRRIGSDFRICYKVNGWHRYPVVIDTQDWMRENIQIGDNLIWSWGEYVGFARVTRRNAHTVSVRHLSRNAINIRASIPWEKVLYAYRIDCPYDVTDVLTDQRLIDIHTREMTELKEIWGMN